MFHKPVKKGKKTNYALVTGSRATAPDLEHKIRFRRKGRQSHLLRFYREGFCTVFYQPNLN